MKGISQLVSHSAMRRCISAPSFHLSLLKQRPLEFNKSTSEREYSICFATSRIQQQQQQHEVVENTNEAQEKQLLWKEKTLKDGTVIYEHPTVEEVLAVKQARLEVARSLAMSEKRFVSKEEKERDSLKASGTYIKPKRKDELRIEREKIITEALGNVRKTLTAEQIEEAKKLRLQDPHRYTSKRLAQKYGVKPEHILQVTKEPEKKVLQDLRDLRERNKNRPKKSSRQVISSKPVKY